MKFCLDWSEFELKLFVFLGSGELYLVVVDQVLTIFHSKFEMPPKSKVVSLEKLDNFYIGRIEVFR
jgi:hypothetical protein